MLVSSILGLKTAINLIVDGFTLRVVEEMVQIEINENYVSLCSYSVNRTTIISGKLGFQLFSGCMTDHFLSGCVVFCPSMSHSGVMPGNVVIALS